MTNDCWTSTPVRQGMSQPALVSRMTHNHSLRMVSAVREVVVGRIQGRGKLDVRVGREEEGLGSGQPRPRVDPPPLPPGSSSVEVGEDGTTVGTTGTLSKYLLSNSDRGGPPKYRSEKFGTRLKRCRRRDGVGRGWGRTKEGRTRLDSRVGLSPGDQRFH